MNSSAPCSTQPPTEFLVSLFASDCKESETDPSAIYFASTSPISSSRTVNPLLEAVLAQQQAIGLKPWMIELQSNLPPLPSDPLSNAEPDKVVTRYLIWDVTKIDFDSRQIEATATYTFKNKQDGNRALVLDVKNLQISQILVNSEPVEATLKLSTNPDQPDALIIPIAPKQGQGTVSIQYRTSPEASGIFWIEKEFTDSKKHPIVYTLFQHNEGASVIPGQHTPQVRLAYEVHIQTGNPDQMALSSVMNNPKERSPDGIYRNLLMPRPVPIYLLSLHAGNFSYHQYEQDPRTGVYAEDTVIQETAEAMKQLPDIMRAAEEICGPYNWGNYAPIILPWAFPYAAMEHPCASTCGKIVRERKTVIPHELAHSWAGNDTTNGTWQQFFWNEGFTTFFEKLITERIWGIDVANMTFMNTLKDAKATMDKFRNTKPDILRLCGQTSSFEFSRIPYAKGALFFFMLQTAIGPEQFPQFIRDYMKVFYSNTMSDQRFLSFLRQWLKHEKNEANFDQFMEQNKVEEWLYGLEIPSNAPTFESKLIEMIDQEKTNLLQGKPLNGDLFKSWGVETQVAFLSQFDTEEISHKHLISLDWQLNLSNSDKMTLLGTWSYLCAQKGYLTDITKRVIIDYVIKRNSMFEADKITTALCKTEEGRRVAQTILEEGAERLFPITQEKIRKILSSSY